MLLLCYLNFNINLPLSSWPINSNNSLLHNVCIICMLLYVVECTVINEGGILLSPGWNGVDDYDVNLSVCWEVIAPEGQVCTCISANKYNV